MLDVFVYKVMDLKLIENSIVPCRFRNGIAGVIACFDSCQKACSLAVVREQLYLQRKLHANIILQIFEVYQEKLVTERYALRSAMNNRVSAHEEVS
jgi:hypothetical protein